MARQGTSQDQSAQPDQAQANGPQQASGTQSPLSQAIQQQISQAMQPILGELQQQIVQAVRQYSIADNVLTFLALFFYSMPSFWFALMLILIFSLRAGQEGWPIQFPASGMTGIEYEYMGAGGKLLDRARHLFLPAVALGIGSAAGVARYMRGAMLEVIHQDFIRTARAKGVPERRVVWVHALRNVAVPLITVVALSYAYLLEGSVLTETVFAWPGLGLYITNALFSADLAAVMGGTIVVGAAFILLNLLSDILYRLIDPRARG